MVKKSLFLSSLFCALHLLSSCQKQDTIDPIEDQKGHFKIEFTNSAAQTLAFWEPDSEKRKQGEACERELHNVSIFVYKDGSDDCVFRRNFSTAEIDKKTSIFSLPEGSYEHNATYDFYAVANFNYGAVSDKPTRPQLLSAVQDDLAKYMGLTSSLAPSDSIMNFSSIYPSVSGDAVALRNDPILGKGFVMSSGKVSAVVPVNENTPRKVLIPISRLTSKTEVRAGISPLFTTNYIDKYGSKLTIDTIKLLNLVTHSYLIASPTKIATTPTYINICQLPEENSGKSCALFYGFENNFEKTSAPAKAVEISVYATFDFDGNPATSDDVSKITYRQDLKLSGDGNMLRNTFYQVDIAINGLTSQEIITTIEVRPWDVLPVENIDFGN